MICAKTYQLPKGEQQGCLPILQRLYEAAGVYDPTLSASWLFSERDAKASLSGLLIQDVSIHYAMAGLNHVRRTIKVTTRQTLVSNEQLLPINEAVLSLASAGSTIVEQVFLMEC